MFTLLLLQPLVVTRLGAGHNGLITIRHTFCLALSSHNTFYATIQSIVRLNKSKLLKKGSFTHCC